MAAPKAGDAVTMPALEPDTWPQLLRRIPTRVWMLVIATIALVTVFILVPAMSKTPMSSTVVIERLLPRVD